MKTHTFEVHKEVPVEQRKREGKAEWPNHLALRMNRRHAFRLLRELVTRLENESETEYTIYRMSTIT